MKVQLSISIAGVPNEEDSYFASVVLLDSGDEVGKTAPRTGNGTFSELVLLEDDTNATVNVLIYSSSNDDSVVVSQQSFDIPALVNSYTQAQAKADEANFVIALHATEQTYGKLLLVLQGHDLPNTDLAGLFLIKPNNKTDPIFEIFGALGQKLKRSNKVEDCLDPVWDEMILDLEDLCGRKKDLNAPIRITVYDKDGGNKVEYLGNVTMTVHQMLQDGSTKIPLTRGGVPVQRATLSVARAELLPDAEVTRSAQKHLEAAVSACQHLEELKDQAAALQATAEEAQAKAAASKEEASAKQTAADALAASHLELESKIFALAEQMVETSKAAESFPIAGTLQLVLAAVDLADVDFGIRNQSDPVYEIFLANGDGERLLRSNKVDNDLNPVWNEQTLDLTKVFSLDTPLKIQVSDKDGHDIYNPLGHVEVTVSALLAASESGEKMMLQDQPKSARGRLMVQKAALLDFQNLKEEAEKLKSECEALMPALEMAAQAFAEAQKEADDVMAVALQAAEDALEALEQAEAAKVAVETAQSAL